MPDQERKHITARELTRRARQVLVAPGERVVGTQTVSPSHSFVDLSRTKEGLNGRKRFEVADPIRLLEEVNALADLLPPYGTRRGVGRKGFTYPKRMVQTPIVAIPDAR